MIFLNAFALLCGWIWGVVSLPWDFYKWCIKTPRRAFWWHLFVLACWTVDIWLYRHSLAMWPCIGVWVWFFLCTIAWLVLWIDQKKTVDTTARPDGKSEST